MMQVTEPNETSGVRLRISLPVLMSCTVGAESFLPTIMAFLFIIVATLRQTISLSPCKSYNQLRNFAYNVIGLNFQ